jgi:hypothetical protein
MPIYGPGGLTHGQALATITGFAAFGTSPLQIVRFNWPGVERQEIEVTNMNVQPTATGVSGASGGNFGNKMYLPSAYVKPGELHLQVNHDSTVQLPMTALPETITISFGPATAGSGGAQETAICLAWMKSYELEGELDGKALVANVVIVITDVLDNTYSSTGAVVITTAQ